MIRYEYKVLPAPAKGVKAKGARTTEARFANALMQIMNEMGRDGWEYQRTDTLPCEERVGLTGRTTRFQNMLVFRRELRGEADIPVALLPAAEPAEPETEGEDPSRDATQRVAETLSARPSEGKAPVLRAVPDSGEAPKLGGATGNGVTRPGV